MDLVHIKHGFLLSLLVMVVSVVLVNGQQAYVNNHQLACYDNSFDSITKGYQCNGVQSNCQSYLTFRSTPTYNSPATIAYLMSGGQAMASRIVSINNISSDVTRIPEDTLVIVPTNCSCLGSEYYQHNASYTLKSNETYFSVANDTYQGLTTCQAMMAQNPYGDRNLSAGLDVEVPLRCACPTRNQTDLGVKYLVTYMVTWGNSGSSIAELFGVDEERLLEANKLDSKSVIFPFTPLLVPVTAEPRFVQQSPSPPPPAPPQIPVVPVSGGSSSKKWVYVGVGIGAGLLVIMLAVVFGVCLYRKRKPKSMPAKANLPPKVVQSTSASDDYMAISDNKSSSWSLSSQGIKYAVESLTLYKFKDLQLATSNFGEANRIKGSVYRGLFNGDAAAVKVMKGDVLSEIDILKKINHSNIIRLSGFCLHEGNTYLVYEYAENGSLSDWLHNKKKLLQGIALSWKQRVQIAHGVSDALNYIHNYTNPTHIHKNLKCSNILLDADLRAKVTNFGLSRSLENDGENGLQMTRHVVGTQGYMAPEYMENGVITPKLDVFAFGVVLLELLSGKEAVSGDRSAGTDVVLHAEIGEVLDGENVRQKLRSFIDPSLKDEYPLDIAFSLAQLAKRCVASDLNARPYMDEVLMIISKIRSSLLDWDPSDEIERSTSLSRGR